MYTLVLAIGHLDKPGWTRVLLHGDPVSADEQGVTKKSATCSEAFPILIGQSDSRRSGGECITTR
jgi:hypothetical protein